ncbi:hypothetical protein Tco_0276966 [Tanacetum coccineum]
MTNAIVTTPVNVTGAPVTNTVANHAEKPEKFNGQNFKRWQQKMFFYLTTLNLAQFLNETAPQVEPPKEGQPSNAQVVQAVEALKHSDFVSQLCFEWSGRLFIQRVLQDHDCQRIMGVIGTQVQNRGCIDDEVIQDQRQRDDNDLQDERQDQPKEEEVEPRRSKMEKTEKSFGLDFVSFMVENEPTSYREAVTSSEWLNGKKPLKVK